MDLRKLTREDLLELMIRESSRIEELEEEIRLLEEQYEAEEQMILSCKTAAEAVLKLNHVTEDLKKASEEYIDAVNLKK